jgi:hypothetical protein
LLRTLVRGFLDIFTKGGEKSAGFRIRASAHLDHPHEREPPIGALILQFPIGEPREAPEVPPVGGLPIAVEPLGKRSRCSSADRLW